MNPTLSYLLGKRMWLVRGINVWGNIDYFDYETLITEVDGSSKRILFGTFGIGANMQVINYADLTDFRGNNLPTTIANPVVVPLGKDQNNVVVQGGETDKFFSLAKANDINITAEVDLLIIELG